MTEKIVWSKNWNRAFWELFEVSCTMALILVGIKTLDNNNNGHASCLDEIITKYIKCISDIVIQVYVKLFNTILDTEIVPEPWTIDIIKQIKKK